MPISIHPPALPQVERPDPAPAAAAAKRAAPAGTYQAWQAERIRQQAALAPAPPVARSPGAPVRRQEREATHEAGQKARRPSAGAEPAPARAEAAASWPRQGDGQGDGARDGGGDGGGREQAPAATVTVTCGFGAAIGEATGCLDPEALAASIAAQAADQELFELLLPGGEQLGVLLSSGPGGTLRVLLASDDAGLRRQLETGRMELEQGLMRRMGQAAQVTVL